MTHSTPSPGRRESLQARLEVAVGRGEMTIDEYDSLCGRVWDAGHDDDSTELDAVAGRLERLESARAPETGRSPSPGPPAPSANPYRNPDPYRPRPADGAAPGKELVGPTPDDDRQSGTPAIFSDKTFTGRWAPQATTTWWGIFGDVKLDLREANWPAARIELDFQSAFSDATVIVPPGTIVVDRTTSILGEVSIKTSSTAPANGLTVILDGVLVFGDIKVRDR